MDYQDEEVAGRLVTAKQGDEVAPFLWVLIEGKTDDSPGHFRFSISEAAVSPGFLYRLIVEGRPDVGLRVVGVTPAKLGGFVADGSVVDLAGA